MKNPFDSYSLIARAFPALASALPLFVLWYFVSREGELGGLTSFLLSFKFLGGITLGVVFLYLYAQLIRTTSKFIEKRYFIEGTGFPTTYLMMYGDSTFSRIYKDAYRERAEAAFGIDLPTQAEEFQNPDETRKRLSEITKHVILQVGDGRLVMEHNIWYGFFRNLVGGALYSVAFCLLNLYVGVVALKNTTLWVSSVVLLVCFSAVVLCSKPILRQHAEAYAKQLIAEFIEENKGKPRAAPDG